MVEFRLGSTATGSRADASDVLQDAFVVAAARLDGFLRDPKLTAFLRPRQVVGERLASVHRHHLGASMHNEQYVAFFFPCCSTRRLARRPSTPRDGGDGPTPGVRRRPGGAAGRQ